MSKGFNLLELMLVLAILGILLVVAIPVSHHLITDNRAASLVNRFLAELHFARSEAVQTGDVVTLCGSSNHSTCDGQWRQGQIVIDQSGKILQVFSALPSQDNLIWNSSGINRDHYLKFLPTGFTQGQKGRFYFCLGQQAYQTVRAIVVENTGRFRIENLNAKDFFKYCIS